MISCKQATQYILKKEEGKLSVKKRFQLWLHLGICSFCKLFMHQSIMINKTVKKSADKIVSVLPESDKKKIRELLEVSI